VEEIIKKKIVANLSDLNILCDRFRKEKLNISCTSGCYDILHDGHLRYLAKAKNLGDILVVGVDNNLLANKMKGPRRPFNDEDTRVFLVAGFMCVDFAVIVDDVDFFISVVKPDVFVMSESTESKPHERVRQIKLIEGLGGRVVALEPQSEKSTTKILQKMGRK